MKMSKIILAAAFVLAFRPGAIAQDKPAAPADAAPKMVVAETTHDFGEVKAGMPLRYSFKVRNEGKADLLIQNVQPG